MTTPSIMSTGQESQLRKRKQIITTSKQEDDDSGVSESAPPPQIEIKQKKDERDIKNWLAGSYWLVRVIFIRCLASIYCKYKSPVIFDNFY